MVETKLFQIEEEFLFEEFSLTASPQESLIKLREILEKLLQVQLSLYSVPFIRLILYYSEKHKLTHEQLRVLIFMNNPENIFESVDEQAYHYILFQSKGLLEQWLTNKEIIPQVFYEVSSFDSEAELPQALTRENYMKAYVVNANLPNNGRKHAELICRSTEGESFRVFVYEPWDKLCNRETFSKGTTVGFYNLKYGNKERVYFCDRNSLMVISPDLLVDVTKIAQSVENVNRYFIERLCGSYGKKSETALIGNIVNDILDDLLLGKKHEGLLISKKINKYKLNTMLADATGENIYPTVNEHVENIVESGLIDEIQSYKDFSMEPTFISNEFGIIGRIDVLCYAEGKKKRDGNKIFELKSGNPRNGLDTAWEEHKAQVALYSLMVQNRKSETENKTVIFYSKDKENPYRDLELVYPDSYIDYIMTRNEMIAFDRLLIAMTANSFERLIDQILNDKKPIKFMDSSLQKLYSLKDILETSSIKNILLNYVAEFIAFYERERYHEKIEFAELWTKSDSYKKDNFKILGPLKFKESDPDKLTVEFSMKSNNSRFRKSDLCVIYDKKEKISEQQIFKGIIKSISEDTVTITLKSEDHIKFLEKKKQWFMEEDFLDVIMIQKTSIMTDFLFLSADGSIYGERKQKLVLGLEPPSFHEAKPLKNEKLTPKQNEAISRAVAAKDYYLIQGPPGTGKTTVLAYLIKELLANEDEKLLVVAFTNRAVDEIMKKFIDEIKNTDQIVRLTSNDVSTEYPEFCLMTLIKDVDEPEILETIKKKRVFFSTVSSNNYKELRSHLNFTTCIVDEASQLLEPDTLAPIMAADKFILVGDEKQLPPIVTQTKNESSVEEITSNIKCLNDIDIKRLDCSLFERLIVRAKKENWDSYSLLDKQFRMNENLLRFSNENFYSSILQSGEVNKDLITEFNEDKEFINNKPLEFFNIIGTGEKKKNKKEADALVELLEAYHKEMKRKELNYSIGVIAPFRAQVSYIHQKLHALGLGDDILVDTVERFQGGERDLIFFSFTVYSQSHMAKMQSLQHFGDIMVDRKLNVAMTRGKRKIILFGNAEILKTNLIFGKLIALCKKMESYHTLPD